jgi:hypothetical protein
VPVRRALFHDNETHSGAHCSRCCVTRRLPEGCVTIPRVSHWLPWIRNRWQRRCSASIDPYSPVAAGVFTMRRRDPQERFYPESRFGGFAERDGTVAFYGPGQSPLTPDSTVLDVGSGRRSGLTDDGLVDRLIPGRRYARVPKGVQPECPGADIFPTGYRVNSVREVRHLLRRVGLDCLAYGYHAEPSARASGEGAMTIRAGFIDRRDSPWACLTIRGLRRVVRIATRNESGSNVPVRVIGANRRNLIGAGLPRLA